MLRCAHQSTPLRACFVSFHSFTHRPVPVRAGVPAAAPLRYVQASLIEAENLFRKGVTLGDEGKWAEASESLSAAVAADLNHSDASCRLGFAEYKKAGKSCDASFEPYTRCLELNPTDTTAHINLAGELRTVRRDVDGAERLLRSALKLDPWSPYAYALLSELLELERGDLDGAIAELESCLRCGGIPGWDGKANLVSLKEKKTKARHAEVRAHHSTTPCPHHARVVFRFVHPPIVLPRSFFLPVCPPRCLSDVCRHLSPKLIICSSRGLRSERRGSGPRRSCRSARRLQRT